ncbi:hypothetical protein EJB05_24002, partial [Eragrostis curvula]
MALVVVAHVVRTRHERRQRAPRHRRDAAGDPGQLPAGVLAGLHAWPRAVDDKDPAAYDADGCLAGLNLFAQMHVQRIAACRRGSGSCAPRTRRGRRLRRLLLCIRSMFGLRIHLIRHESVAGKTGLFDKGSVTQACCDTGGDVWLAGRNGVREAGHVPKLGWGAPDLTQRAYGVMTDLLYDKGFASPAPVSSLAS